MRTWGGWLERPILRLRNLSKARGWEQQHDNDPEDPATSSVHTTSITMTFADNCRTVEPACLEWLSATTHSPSGKRRPISCRLPAAAATGIRSDGPSRLIVRQRRA